MTCRPNATECCLHVCSLPLVLVETNQIGYLVEKKLVILLLECVVGKMFYVNFVYVFLSARYLCWDSNIINKIK